MGVRTASTITTSRPLPFCISVYLRRSPAEGMCSARRRAVTLPGGTVPDRLTGESTKVTERIGIVGSGAIACGLARLAGPRDVVVWARSEASAEAARDEIGEGAQVVTDLAELADRAFVVEAVVEDLDAKSALIAELRERLGDSAILATTTSSL